MTALGVSVEQPKTEVIAWQRRWAVPRRALGFGRTRLGLGIVGLLVVTAVIGPWVAPHSPTDFIGAPYMHPSSAAWLGTDGVGRDVLSRFLSGGRTVIGMSLLATVSGVGLGAAIGLFAAYSRNWLDSALMRVNDVLLAFPQIIFVLLVLGGFGQNLVLLAVTVGLTHAPRTALVIRAAAVEIAERDFVSAARAAGENRWRIMLVEMLPNVSSCLLVEFGLRLTYSIGLVASVSFLGFGLQPPAADWGTMINENQLGIQIQPWGVVAPMAAIALLTVGVNLATDGLARASIGIDGSSSQ